MIIARILGLLSFLSMANVLNITPPSNTPKAKPPQKPLSPVLATLSEHKLAKICLVNMSDDNKSWTLEPESEIVALLAEGNKTLDIQWQTPFENSNPEHKLPTLMAGLQTGQITASVAGTISGNETFDNLAKEAVNLVEMIDPVTGKMKEALKDLKGRSNLTKINTEKVFLSSSGHQISITLQFLAFSDAKEEVERQIMRLESYSVPRYLAESGLVENVSKDGLKGLFASLIPRYVSLTTHGKTYAPLVIESISAPIVAPADEDGNRLSISVDMTLSSRTSIDATDIAKLYGY